MADSQVDYSTFAPSPQQLHITYLYQAAALALLVYNWVLTSHDEIKHIWTGKRRMTSTLLFLGVRYFPLLSSIITVAASGLPQSNKRCIPRTCN
ncbi:hypothetical protein PsYK624_138690 [Phanerochaete sordida]|uniref:DUF6533 domain-containing protein n=1 Tax=Phanerochaete sordida TaxID=48140 RepID=A0A9P3LJR2_9APHY|nr:hypothetical protein PsYK624_138690 [Phanerochaete sordida]